MCITSMQPVARIACYRCDWAPLRRLCSLRSSRSAANGKLPWQVLAWYALLSVITFVVYRSDKSAATQREWRTSEQTLHGLAVAGGWPGALIAQRWLRHKSKKASFLAAFAVTVVVNLAGSRGCIRLTAPRRCEDFSLSGLRC